MKKTLLIIGMCSSAALFSQSALADVKLRAGIASDTYNLSGDYITAKSSFKPLTLGLTVSGDSGMYVDLATSSGTGTHDGWGYLGYPAEQFKRTDLALTVGSSFMNQDMGVAFAVYGGYKTGTTTLGAQNVPANLILWMEETFKSSGVIAGGGANFPINGGASGSVGVNLGIGFMSATWADTTGFSAKAKTVVGSSLGVSYSYPFTPSVGIVADYKINSYTYKFDGGAAWTPTIKEKINALGISAYLKF